MKSLKSFLIWGIVVLVGLASFTTLALSRGEQVSAILDGYGRHFGILYCLPFLQSLHCQPCDAA